MSIRQSILNASMKEMFDLAQHLRGHASVSRAPMPSTGDLIEHVWIWANTEPSDGADAALEAVIGRDDVESDPVEAAADHVEDESVETPTVASPEPVAETTAGAPEMTDAPEMNVAEFAPMPLSTEGDVDADEDPAEARRQRRERRALEAARKQAEAVAGAMADKTTPAS